ncbi:MAG TPA: hypothetical protein VFE33_18830 [Thermoanaerobaculia bacterium]|nr:hypothetical protein [Thermoanaerobaculia bacterium]
MRSSRGDLGAWRPAPFVSAAAFRSLSLATFFALATQWLDFLERRAGAADDIRRVTVLLF